MSFLLHKIGISPRRFFYIVFPIVSILFFLFTPLAQASYLPTANSNVGIGTFSPYGGRLIVVGGNVGVGTTTPQTLMAVQGNVGIGTWTAEGGNLIVNGGGNVGINSAWPGQRLDVFGIVRSANGGFMFPDGTTQASAAATGSFQDDGAIVHLVTPTDNVGIGTVDAWRGKLIVTGGNVGFETTSPGSTLSVLGGLSLGAYAPNTASEGGMIVSGNVGIGTTDATSGKLIVLGGNVGIGSSAPSQFLDINGDVRIGLGTFNNGSSDTDLYVSGNLEVDGSVWLGDAVTDNLTIIGTFSQTGDANISGNFGVGTTTPQTKMAVLGPVGIGTWTTPAGAGLVVLNGNVGIGTTNVSEQLVVLGNVVGSNIYAKDPNNVSALSGTGNVRAPWVGGSSLNNSIGFYSDPTNFASFYLGGGWANIDVNYSFMNMGLRMGASANGDVALFTDDITRLFISRGIGNVGIGTITPANRLAIDGGVGIGTSIGSGFFKVSAPSGGLIVEGNVGIGTWLPTAALEVGSGSQNGDNQVILGGLNSFYQIKAPGLSAKFSADQVGSFTTRPYAVVSGGANRIFLNASDNGIALGGYAGVLSSNGSATVDSLTYDSNVGFGTFAPNARLVVSGGNVGIGSLAPGSMLDVNGDVRIGLGTFNNPSSDTDLFVSGNLEVDGSIWLGDAAADNLTVVGTFSQTGDATIVGNSSVTGNFGVGTTTPQTKLAVLGPVGIGTWTVNAGVGLSVMNGNVGFGTTTPGGGLIVMNGRVGVGTWNPQSTLSVSRPLGEGVGVIAGFGANGVDSIITIGYGEGSHSNESTLRGSPYGSLVLASQANQSVILTPNGTGRVGIGSLEPSSFLDINGDTRIGLGTFNNPSSNTDLYVSGNLEVDGSIWLGDAAADNLTIVGTFTQTGDASLTGNFGVGTTTPQTKLAVLGPVGIGTWTTGPGVSMAVFGGNVGIGTITPLQLLDVYGTSRFGGNMTFSVDNTYEIGSGGLRPSNVRIGGNLYLESGVGLVEWPGHAAIRSQAFGIILLTDTAGTDFDRLQFSNGGAAAPAIKKHGAGLEIKLGDDSDFSTLAASNIGVGTDLTGARGRLIVVGGNVGIGSLTPGSLLDVNGDVRIGLGTFNNPTSNTDLYVSGNLEVDGSTFLGDSVADSLTVEGTFNKIGEMGVTGNLGVGTTTPQTKLAVLGPVGIGTWTTEPGVGLTVLGGNVGIGTATPQDAFVVTNGNVGIGTWAPLYPLSVVTSSNQFLAKFLSKSSTAEVDISSGGGFNSALFLGSNDTRGWGLIYNKVLTDINSYRTSGTFELFNYLSGTPVIRIDENARLGFMIDAAGNIGISTFYSPSRLTVMGNVGIGSTGSSYVNTTAPANGMMVQGNVGIGTFENINGKLIVDGGSVGIGSTAPSSKLDVNGDVRIGLGTFNNPSSDTDLFVSGNLEVDGSIWLGDAAADNLTVVGNFSQTGNTVMTGDTSVSGNFGIGTTTPQTKLAVLGPVGIGTWTVTPGTALAVMNGNVGVGTLTPLAAIDIMGGNFHLKNLVPSGMGPRFIMDNSAGFGEGAVDFYTVNGVNFLTHVPQARWHAVDDGDYSANMFFEAGSPTLGGFNANTYNTNLTILSSGNVGVGRDTSPDAVLDISKIGSVAPLMVSSSSIADGDYFIIDSSGNIGIGSGAPSGRLDVNGDVRIGLGTFNNPSSDTDLFVSGNLEVDGSTWLGDAVSDSLEVTGTFNKIGQMGVTGNLGVGTTTPQTTLAILGPVGIGTWTTEPDSGLIVLSGNVGIGTVTPGVKLDVNGQVRSTTGGFVFPDGTSQITAASGGGFSDDGTYVRLTTITDSVGIGTTVPISKFVVAGGGVGVGTNVNSTFIQTAAPAGGMLIEGNVGIGTTITSNAGMSVMTGNVGIGTWVPGQALDVTGSISASNQLIATNLVIRPNAQTTTIGNTGSDLYTLAITSVSTGLDALIRGGYGIAGDNFYTPVGGVFGFGQNYALGQYPSTGVDTGMSRLALGVVGVGNGVTGNYSGAFVATNIGVGTFDVSGGGLIVKTSKVGIGSLAPSSLLDVNGDVRIGLGTFNNPSNDTDLYVSGNLEVDGSIWLGDAVTDNLTVVGTFNQTGDASITGNFGIGTTTPQTKLSVLGPVGIGTWTTQPGVGLAVMNGNVGIGTWVPGAKLYVDGTLTSTGIATLPSGSVISSVTHGYNGTTHSFTNSNNYGFWSNNNTVVGNFGFYSPNGVLAFGTGMDASDLYLSRKAAANLHLGYADAAAPVSQTLGVQGARGGTDTDVSGGNLTIQSGLGTGSAAASNIYFQTPVPTASGTAAQASSTVMALVGSNVGIGTNTPVGALTVMSGNVGIGTWVPSTALEVKGEIVTSGYVYSSSVNPAWRVFPIYNDGGGEFELDGYNNYLVIWPNNVVGDNGLTLRNVAGTDKAHFSFGSQTIFALRGEAAQTANLQEWQDSSNAALSVVGGGGNIGIGTNAATSGKLIVMGGNVGIGSLSPGSLLDINGDVRIGLGTFNNPSSDTDLYVSGNLEVDGSIWLGDAAADNLTVVGTFSQTGNSTIVGDSSVTGNFGVGTTTPQVKLAVLGPVGIGTWTTSAGAALTVLGGNVGIGTILTTTSGVTIMNGNVGIGTWKPTQVLDVNGRVQFAGFVSDINNSFYSFDGGGASSFVNNGGYLTFKPTGAFNGLWIADSSDSVVLGFSNASAIGIGGNAGGSKVNLHGNTSVGLNYAPYSAPTNGLIVEGNVGIGTDMTSAAARLSVMGGNVGIGSLTPGSLLDINGDVRIGLGTFNNPSSDTDLYVSGNLEVDGSVWLGDAAADNLTIVGTLNQTGDITTTANLGVGTTTPQTKLAVLGPVGIGTWTTQTGVALSIYGGNVGVGTLNPGVPLDVNGIIRSTSGGFRFPDGTTQISAASGGGFVDDGTIVHLETNTDNVGIGTTDASNGKLIVTGGNVGIGTTTPMGGFVVMNGNVGIGTWAPQALLDVSGGGDSYFSSNVGIGTSNPSEMLEVIGTGKFTAINTPQISNLTSNGFVKTSSGDGTLSVDTGTYPTYGTMTTNYVQKATSSTAIGNSSIFDNGTNVGIGSAAPSQFLDINGDVRIGLGTFNNPSSNTDLYVSGNLEVDGSIWLGDAAADNLTVVGTFAQTGDTVVTGNSSVSGNFGIGTTTPQTKLAVLGPVGIGTWSVATGVGLSVMNGNVGIGTWLPRGLLDVVGAGDTFFSANVGIGTDVPGYALDVSGTGSFTAAVIPKLSNLVSNGFVKTSAGDGTLSVDTSTYVTSSMNTGYIQKASSTTAINDSALFQLGSNIGIGSVNPGTVLDVNGMIRTTSGGIRFPDGTTQISAASGGGFTDDGTVVHLTTDSDNVGIGTTDTSSSKLVVTGGNVGIGTTVPQGDVHVRGAGARGQVTIDGSSGGCFMIRDTTGSTWTECYTLGGVMSCSVDADGICDGS